jgi:hypothetical protein
MTKHIIPSMEMDIKASVNSRLKAYRHSTINDPISTKLIDIDILSKRLFSIHPPLG